MKIQALSVSHRGLWVAMQWQKVEPSFLSCFFIVYISRYEKPLLCCHWWNSEQSVIDIISEWRQHVQTERHVSGKPILSARTELDRQCWTYTRIFNARKLQDGLHYQLFVTPLLNQRIYGLLPIKDSFICTFNALQSSLLSNKCISQECLIVICSHIR